MNRRDFILRTGTAAAGSILAGQIGTAAAAARVGGGGVRAVALVTDPGDSIAASAPARWAAQQLAAALTEIGVVVREYRNLGEAGAAAYTILICGGAAAHAWARQGAVPLASSAEALALAPVKLGGRETLLAAGHDIRGLIYALTELADAVAMGEDIATTLRPRDYIVEQPANAVRSVMRMPISEVEDKAWFNDKDFWRRYLSLLVTQRFNRFSLALGLGYDRPNNVTDTYFYFAYPFFVSVPGYKVRATNLSDTERDQNFAMLRFISEEAAARGLQFQLGLWTHAYQWINSPKANHIIEGLTPQTQALYSRDALTIILKECPNITGVTFRIHGESGVPEGSYDLWKTIFDGCVRSGRPIEIDMHAKGMDQPTLDVALGTGLPVVISPKFWAEHLGLPYHQAAIRPAELPKREKGSGLYSQSEGARSFLRYGYGDLLREDRRYNIVHRVWPGTQHLLLWGDPVFAAGYGRAMQFCGSQGGEIFDPLSFRGREGSSTAGNGGREGYADATLRPAGGDFMKYAQTYRLWGRMLYNPASRPGVWERALRHDYRSAAVPAGQALAPASRILPLLTTAYLPTASNLSFGFEVGPNMSLVGETGNGPYGETKSPSRFGNASPLDPQLFLSADAFAAEILAGKRSARYSPLDTAQWLEDLAQQATEALAQPGMANGNKEDVSSAAYRRMSVDVQAQAALGIYYGKKFRAAVLYAIYLGTGYRPALDSAVATYRLARDSWAKLIQATTGAYVKDLTFGERWYQRGNWADRLDAIDKDIATLAQQAGSVMAPRDSQGRLDQSALDAAVAAATDRPFRSSPNLFHQPPAGFRRGVEISVEAEVQNTNVPPTSLVLHYRHACQAETWQSAAMRLDGGKWSASIPAIYTNTIYPLLYYFAVQMGATAPSTYPGLGPNLAAQPYYTLRALT